MEARPTEIIASVDITGSNRPWDLVWLRCDDNHVQSRRFTGKSKADDFLEWAKETRPRIIAIDAPSGHNLSRTHDPELRRLRGWTDDSYRNMRLCEADLRSREIKLYYTPSDAKKAAAWIVNGWNLYERLKHDLNYQLWNGVGQVELAEDRWLIEVHPHACFVVGLGWIPQAKAALAGQLERVSHLLEAAKCNGQALIGECIPDETLIEAIIQKLQSVTWKGIRSDGLELPSLSHDVLDALAGLVTAIHATEGRAFAVGDSDEGVIVLPSEPAKSYRRKRGS